MLTVLVGGGSLSQAERFRAARSPRLFLMGIRAGGQRRLGPELGTGPRRASAPRHTEPLVSGGQNSRSGPCQAVAARDGAESPGACSPTSGVGVEGEEPHVEEAGVGGGGDPVGGETRGGQRPGGRPAQRRG